MSNTYLESMVELVVGQDVVAEARYGDVWHEQREDTGERRLARAMIEQAIVDGDIDWFFSAFGQVCCEAMRLEPSAVRREMRKWKMRAA